MNTTWYFSRISKKIFPIRTFCTEIRTSLEKSINRAVLLGRVGIDPQLRGRDSKPVLIFTLATNSNYRYGEGEVRQKTEWHRISVFRDNLRTSLQQYLKKGSRVLVEGKITYGEIKDASGTTHVTTTIVADDVICLGEDRS